MEKVMCPICDEELKLVMLTKDTKDEELIHICKTDRVSNEITDVIEYGDIVTFETSLD